MSTNPYAAPPPATERDALDRRMPVESVELLRSTGWITTAAVVLTLFAVGFGVGAITGIWNALSFPPESPLAVDTWRAYYVKSTMIASLRCAVNAAALTYATRGVWSYRGVMRSIARETATWSDFALAHRRAWSGIGIAVLTIIMANALSGMVTAFLLAAR